MTADSRVQLISCLAGKQPRQIEGMPESEWVDFKGVGPDGSGLYDLKSDKGKFELAKDVAAFANAGGGLIVCGFKASQRPSELHEVAVRPTPFEKKLVNVNTYKDVIAEYVRPPVTVNYHWYDHPDDDPDAAGSYFVIEVAALPESDRWALVTRCLNDDGKFVKGSLTVPIRNGDTTRYLSPDDAYRLLNDGLRGERQIDVNVTAATGAVWDLRMPDAQFEQLLEARRKELLSVLPRPRRPSPVESVASLQLAMEEYVESSRGSLLRGDTRSTEEYRAEVDAYIENCREQMPSALRAAQAQHCGPLRLRLENSSDAMLHQVEVIARLSPAHTAVLTTASDDMPDHATTAWPPAPIPYGKKTYLSSLSTVGLTANASLPPTLLAGLLRGDHPAPKRPEIHTTAEGLTIRFPAVDLRPQTSLLLNRVTVYGRALDGDSAMVRWTATCTNLDGRAQGELTIPVQHTDVPLSVE